MTSWGRYRHGLVGVRLAAAVVALLGALLLAVVSAAPAAAHAKVVSTDPADGAVLAAVPLALTVTFDESMLGDGQGMIVTTPAGDQVTLEAKISGSTLSAPGPFGGGAGKYTVSWRAVSEDGHPVNGTLAFTVKGAPSPSSSTSSAAASPTSASPTSASPTSASPTAASPTAAPVPSDGGSSLPWPLILAGVALLGVIAAAVFVSRRGGTEL